MYKIAVSSVNYSKVGAVKEFFKDKLGNSIKVVGVPTESIVRAIPIGLEGVTGVHHRVNTLQGDYDIKVGFEGTFFDTEHKKWLQNIVAIEWPEQRVRRFIGAGHMFRIPEPAFALAERGYKFHETIIALENAQNKSQDFKENLTIAGILTNGAYTRIQNNITALDDIWRQVEGTQKRPSIATNKVKIDEKSVLFNMEKYCLLDYACFRLLDELDLKEKSKDE